MSKPQQYIDPSLQKAIHNGLFDSVSSFQYYIEEGPDHCNPSWTMDIIKGDSIVLHLVYFSLEDAEHDAELLERVFNIEEA